SAGLPIFPKPSHHDIETNHRPYKSVVFFSKMELCKVLIFSTLFPYLKGPAPTPVEGGASESSYSFTIF
ncbi:hypothetical protein P4V00_08390, partial [Brevibacillus agri]|nr:hypothetical protein [Brevibacillus agri]